jgi:CRP/FNR family transcriptional regulator, cyclic AMP receptor protein
LSENLLERFGKFFPAGTVLFREGDPGREMFVIHSGKVELTRRMQDREAVLAVIPQGEFFGEMAVVNNRPRSATATVREDSWLLVIEAKTFEAMIRGKAEIAVRMIKAMANRLEQANQQIELLLLKDANHRVVQALRRMAESSQGTHVEGSGIFLPVSMSALAGRVALDEKQVEEVVDRLRQARLVLNAAEVGYGAEGFIVPEVGRLLDFLEFLEMKERFSGV